MDQGRDYQDMSDQERVLELVEQGKITQDEAERLLAALGEVEEVEIEVEALEQEAQVEQRPVKEKGAPASRSSEAGQATPSAAAVSPPDNLPWVQVNLLTGDLDISVDPSLAEPVVEGKAEVVKEGRDFIVKAKVSSSGDGFGDFINRMVSKMGDLSVCIPPGYGVKLESKAGDVDINDVPFLQGSLFAGDIDAHNIGGVNLAVKAGDIDISLRPTAGEHRISATAGDIDVTLLAGSSVQVEGSVSMGDFHAEGFSVDTKRSLTGGAFSGRVGGGEASLNLQLSAGDLNVNAEGESHD